MKDKKILIVDDSKSMVEILRDMLSRAGYKNIVTAQSGDEALEITKKESPALVLLDIIMAGTNGMDVLLEIGRSTPVIVLSAIGQDDIIAQAKNLGAVDYLVKPINEADLVRFVEKYK